MLEQERLEVFAAQTENVRALEQAWKHINKTINAAYSSGDNSTAEIHTKLLAQVYCAFAEAVFSKVIHTPDGLTLDEISQVKSRGKKNIVDAWKKCVELSLQKVEGKSSGHVANTRKKIELLIDHYIYDPSLLRNKIAHGQWKVALNSNNTKVNSALTIKIQAISVVDLYRHKEAFQSLFRIVEDIIESPNKAHHRDYWSHITEFEESQCKMASWTIENKIASLKAKKERFKHAKGITSQSSQTQQSCVAV
ncbi:hypothetical protein JG479_12460 [Pseudoalteromonas sp. LC2018020214]|uniref:hypothetical protein n=1 Tax=Pseudoalteromonas sp. LC2018020214 TaxID=2799564 RepID=UPI001904F25E|nr:hypothetical protein [Pseudoalteromonas sp. LC2018020214]QQM63538.1 hypothetical protein JG479_12460 [Pseudoalteromonas sp. LC2018020214]